MNCVHLCVRAVAGVTDSLRYRILSHRLSNTQNRAIDPHLALRLGG